MKKILIAATLATTLSATGAFAQSHSAYAKKFEGLSLYGTVNAANSKYKEYSPGSTLDSSDSDVNGTLGLQYDWALADNFVLGLGWNGSVNNLRTGAGNNLSNMYSLYLTPGVSLSDAVLLYGKIGTLTGRVSTTSTGSQDLNGMAYGVGLRMFSDRNVFFSLEYQQLRYDDKRVGNVTEGAQSNQLSVGVGYRF